MNIEKLVNNCFNKMQLECPTLNSLNIIIMGKTGVGKSTLINTIFQEDIANTGQGKPITQEMKVYTKPNFPLKIYDTKGLELGENAQYEVKQEILNTIKEQNNIKDISESIHCIWYCINANADRLEDEELNWIKTFSDETKTTNVPIILILTKSILKKQRERFINWIKDQNLNVEDVLPILVIDEDFNDKIIPAFGLTNLFETIEIILPSKILLTYLNVQKNELELRKKKALTVVNSTAGITAAQGAIPVAFADALLLIPTQVTMLTSITVIFGLKLDEGILTTLASSILGCSGATIAGKGIANCIKAIPGVGTIIGGIASSATAFTLTNALGRAYIKLMVMIVEGKVSVKELETDKGKELFKKLFESN